MVSGLLEYLEEVLVIEDTYGDELYAECPFCGKGKKHFSVNVDKGVFNCYRCMSRGTYRKLINATEGTHMSNNQISEFLKSYWEDVSIGILEDILQKKNTNGKKKKVDTDKITDIQEIEGVVSITDYTGGSNIHKKAIKYLIHRNITQVQMKKYNICVGLEGDLKGFVVFPVYEEGSLQSYVGRSFLPNLPRYTGPTGGGVWVDKRNLLFGIDYLGDTKEVVLVEGIFDALALAPLTKATPVAILGKAVTGEQSMKLLQHGVTSVTILFDGSVTSKEINRSVVRLVGIIPEVYVATLTSGKDPSESTKSALTAISTAERVV